MVEHEQKLHKHKPFSISQSYRNGRQGSSFFRKLAMFVIIGIIIYAIYKKCAARRRQRNQRSSPPPYNANPDQPPPYQPNDDNPPPPYGFKEEYTEGKKTVNFLQLGLFYLN